MAASRAGLILKAVKKISVQFCPFESNARSTREFLVLVGSEKARSTNLNCEVMTDVKHDASEPVVDILFLDGDRLVMKGARLTSREMITAFQTRCIVKDPQAKMSARK